ncbi:hypothetical protein C7453_11244 [Gluconacetobacter liquefaciens]|uniref:Uncharacterized protein n=1 Tax=Gluconacetobacter liquefaciens TaxID=89584 RepID=A0A370G276_GLULI|nr:hypothetical protein C7453_11244 [Gluconacetobacter liquefaciens]
MRERPGELRGAQREAEKTGPGQDHAEKPA